MSTNSTLKEFRILVHTLKGERKRQIKGVRVDVYEKNKKHDKVWGTLQKSLGQAAKMWWQLECQTDSLRSAYVTVYVFVWVQPSIHACQGRKLNHIHTQLQEVWFFHNLKSYFSNSYALNEHLVSTLSTRKIRKKTLLHKFLHSLNVITNN